MTPFRESLSRLCEELAETGCWFHGEYVIFGSTALKLRGIIDRLPDDIDVMVTRRTWGRLLDRPGWRVETPGVGDPPILTFDTEHPLHLFFDWRDPAVEIDPVYLLKTAEPVKYCGRRFVLRWHCAAVEEVLRHKQQAYACLDKFPSVAKHGPDIEACERWLAERSSS